LAENHAPHPDVDVATFVLASLDALLATQTEIRQKLAPGRMSLPGERWHSAAASMVAARRYADDLAVALGAAAPESRPVRTRRRSYPVSVRRAARALR
jgi:hypothetical protein